MPQDTNDQQRLVQILQAAYSGELAAAYAYRGHWKSVKDPQEKEQIKIIEEEEWHHREQVLEMLSFFKAKPVWWREAIFYSIGRTLGLFCFLSGWFFPMFFAGRLETQNVTEYTDAVYYANKLGLKNFSESLQKMSDKELEHEKFFYEIIDGHWLLPIMKKVYTLKPEYLKQKD